MNEFERLANLSDCPDHVLATWLNVRTDTIRHWRSGRRDAPPNVLLEMQKLTAAHAARAVRK